MSTLEGSISHYGERELIGTFFFPFYDESEFDEYVYNNNLGGPKKNTGKSASSASASSASASSASASSASASASSYQNKDIFFDQYQEETRLENEKKIRLQSLAAEIRKKISTKKQTKINKLTPFLNKHTEEANMKKNMFRYLLMSDNNDERVRCAHNFGELDHNGNHNGKVKKLACNALTSLSSSSGPGGTLDKLAKNMKTCLENRYSDATFDVEERSYEPASGGGYGLHIYRTSKTTHGRANQKKESFHYAFHIPRGNFRPNANSDGMMHAKDNNNRSSLVTLIPELMMEAEVKGGNTIPHFYLRFKKEGATDRTRVTVKYGECCLLATDILMRTDPRLAIPLEEIPHELRNNADALIAGGNLRICRDINEPMLIDMIRAQEEGGGGGGGAQFEDSIRAYKEWKAVEEKKSKISEKITKLRSSASPPPPDFMELTKYANKEYQSFCKTIDEFEKTFLSKLPGRIDKVVEKVQLKEESLGLQKKYTNILTIPLDRILQNAELVREDIRCIDDVVSMREGDIPIEDMETIINYTIKECHHKIAQILSDKEFLQKNCIMVDEGKCELRDMKEAPELKEEEDVRKQAAEGQGEVRKQAAEEKEEEAAGRRRTIKKQKKQKKQTKRKQKRLKKRTTQKK